MDWNGDKVSQLGQTTPQGVIYIYLDVGLVVTRILEIESENGLIEKSLYFFLLNLS